MLLGKRSLVVQVAKNKDLAKTEEQGREFVDSVVAAASYADIAKSLITHAALTIGGTFIVCKVVERLCR